MSTPKAPDPLRARRTFMRGLSAVAIAGLARSGPAGAQGKYPSRPIRLVLPFAAGGAGDVIARPVARKLQEVLGQPIVADFKGGASGAIGMSDVARAAPDGYTLLLCHASNITMMPIAKPNVQFIAPKYFDPVTTLVSGPVVAVVKSDSRFRTLADLISYAKENPGKLVHGSAGLGTSTHVSGVLLSRAAQIQLLHVPYKGFGPIVTEILAGRVDIAFGSASSVMSLIQAGKLRPLAVFDGKRSAQLPEVPAVAETYPDVVVNSWFGILAPKGTPRDVVQVLQEAFHDVMKSSELQTWAKASSFDIVVDTPASMAQLIEVDIARWEPILEAEQLIEK